MKKILSTLLSVLFCAITFAQSVPQGINYQAVARDANGDVLMNQALTIQFSVISDITTSAVSWQETHQDTTNAYGLFTAIIGDAINGTSTNGGFSATFDVIDWGVSNHLLKVEVDYGGGFVDMGTTAFMSVPYALNSTPQSLTISGDTLFISSGNSIVIPGLSLINSLIVQGCTDSTALNYDASANTDDGSCISGAIGDLYQGGIIFYLDGNGGGLICDIQDLVPSEWGCYGTSISGADDTAIGTGNQNTFDIEAGCNTSGTAADICANLTLNGYSDWFLPSKDELNEMYVNKTAISFTAIANGGGGFVNQYYQSSTEVNANSVWSQSLGSGWQASYSSKGSINRVRAVRAFGNVTIITGCTDPTATNYNAAANFDNGSCIAVVLGCTDSTATNYNPLALTDDGSCTFSISIGDTHQGGIIFWLDASGGHGLIAAPIDQSTGAEWGCLGSLISGADGIAIGTGNQNTIDIEAGCVTSGTAADICANYTDGTYSDWFLPSKDELNQMYLNLHLQGLGGFASGYYWSSTEYDGTNAWLQFFGDGYQGLTNKGSNDYVRAVRAF